MHDPSTRRQFLTASAALTGALAANASASSPPPDASTASRRSTAADEDLLDAALERIQASFPSRDPDRANHVAMVSEAMLVLGHAGAIAAWLDANDEPVAPELGPIAPLDAERWRESLGTYERFADWRALFLAELARDDWRAVLRAWGPRLAPGLAGAATHGVIRTAHAARSLGKRDTAIRRAELATGLAYWAATYEELPWDGREAPERSVADALARVAPRLPQRAPPRGNFVAGLRALGETPSFRPVAGWVPLDDPARTLSESSAAFARLYLRDPSRRVAFAHTITAPSALRLLAPHLDDATVRVAARCAWQAAAGLYVVYGDPRLPEPAPPAPLAETELAARAVANGAAHGVKLTEACLREHALSRDPVLLAAARDAADELDG